MFKISLKRISVLLVGMGLISLVGCLRPGDQILAHSDQSSIIFVKEPIINSRGDRVENSVMRSNSDEFRPGTDIYQLSPVSPNGKLTNLTNAFHGGKGAANDPEVSYDGKRILFSMKKSSQDNWRIYEMNSDGSNLQVVTSPLVGDDFDPAYLPNGNIVFVSTRTQIVDEYERRLSPLLHIGVRSNGSTGDVKNSNVRQISFNQSHDANPFVHSSGHIYFSRWEHLGSPNKFTMFSIKPDGTGLFFLYGSHTPTGDGSRTMFEGRELSDKGVVVSVMTRNSPHEGGAIAILDLNKVEADLDFITPKGVEWNNNGDATTKALYKSPFPIMDNELERILVSMSPLAVSGSMDDPLVDYGIYIMDKDGKNQSMVYNDPDYNEFDAMPVKSSPAPKIIEMDANVLKGISDKK